MWIQDAHLTCCLLVFIILVYVHDCEFLSVFEKNRILPK